MHGLYAITLLVFVVGPAIAALHDSLDGLPVDPPASTFYDVNQHQVDPYSEWKKSPTTILPSTEASTTPATTTTTPQPATVKQPKTTSTAVIETTMSATDEFLEELAKEEEGLVEDDPYSTTMFPDGLEATTLSALGETEMMAEETYLEQEEQELTKEIAAEQDEGWKEMEEEELKEVEEEEQIIKEELEKTLGESSPPTSTNRSATTPAITASSSTTTDTTPESTTATSVSVISTDSTSTAYVTENTTSTMSSPENSTTPQPYSTQQPSTTSDPTTSTLIISTQSTAAVEVTSQTVEATTQASTANSTDEINEEEAEGDRPLTSLMPENTTEKSWNSTESTPQHRTHGGVVYGNNDRTMAASLIAALVCGCLFFTALVVLVGKRIYDSWQRRHYTKIDYLINGMYN